MTLIKSTLFKTSFLLIILIWFTNCNNDINENQILDDSQQIKTKFTLENFKDSFIKENLIVN